jgi:mannose-1-phosphate guanylyltransferase
MLEESINRISPLIPPEDIFIITGEFLLEPIRKALPELPAENVIAEPHKRNTAPCLALAAGFISSKFKDEYKPEEISIAVLTADQSIYPDEGFINTVSSALDYVEKNKVLCTIGIRPARPETGFGYIEVPDKFDYESKKSEIMPVKVFHEKPDSITAKKYLESGKFLWNSGMFFWRLDTFIENMIRFLPDVGKNIDNISKKYFGKTNLPLPEPLRTIDELFYNFPDISIDYGLMEKATGVAVVKALFNWDDIGSWDSLHRVKHPDMNNNIIEGNSVIVESCDSVIVNASENGKKIIAGLGLDNMVVIVTDDAVLVCPKNRVQEVKKCVEEIKELGSDKWL